MKEQIIKKDVPGLDDIGSRVGGVSELADLRRTNQLMAVFADAAAHQEDWFV